MRRMRTRQTGEGEDEDTRQFKDSTTQDTIDKGEGEDEDTRHYTRNNRQGEVKMRMRINTHTQLQLTT